MNNSLIFRTAVIILLLTNISVTAYFSNNVSSNNCNRENASTKHPPPIKEESFPHGLNEAVITKIFFSISEPYSSKNFKKLLSLLDTDMVNKLGKENILDEFNKIYSIFGPITEGFFSSVYPIDTTGKRLYRIDYDVGLSEASLAGKNAILSVTIQLDNNGHRIKGIFLNIPATQKE